MQSSELTSPLGMTIPFALNGNKNIPNETASGTETCSLNLGFLPITQEPLDDGGIAPERIDFNGMFYLATDQRVFLQNGGVITFNDAVNTAIGGYPKNAILGYIDNTGRFGFVRSLIENNQYNFVADPSYIDGINWEYVNLKNFDLLTPQFTTLQNNINTLSSQVVKIAGAQTVTGNKTFSGTSTFTGTIKVPNTATTGTAVSTQAISKSGNGYIKFGNGIIIQWGKNNVGTGNTDITLPTAFTSTNYRVTAMDAAFREGTGFQRISGGAYSTTKIRLCATSNPTYTCWLAIGY